MRVILVLMIAAIGLTSCKMATRVFAQGPISTRAEQFSGFNAIIISDGIEVELVKDAHSAASISVQQSVLPYVEAYVADSILFIKFKDRTDVTGDFNLTVIATTPAVASIECYNGASIFNISNGGFEPHLKLSASDGSRISINGSVDTLTADGCDGSTFACNNLTVMQQANIKLTSGSNAQFILSGTTNVDLSQGSILSYHGNCIIGNANISPDSQLIQF